MIKALRCIASQRDNGIFCYADSFNLENPDKHMCCFKKESDDDILCPYYQNEYDVDGCQFEWLNELANIIENIGGIVET